MLGRAFGTLAALTIGANAFLLPPGIKSTSTSAFANPLTQSLKLPCPDCVFPGHNEHVADAGDDDDVFWIQGRDRAVVLNFTLSDDMKAVNINGWQVYPVSMDNPSEPTVAEVAGATSFTDLEHHPEQATTLDVTAAGIFVNEEIVSDAGDKIVKVNYQVMSLQGQPISVDGAEVKLLQGADDTLMIISVEDVPKSHSIFDSNPLPPPPHPDEKECGMLPAALCKWKSAVEAKIGGFKQGLPKMGCSGLRKGPHKLPGHIRPHFDHFEDSVDEEGHAHLEKPDGEERPKHHHGHPHPHGPHGMHRGPHHHGHHRHHFVHRFVGAFMSVLVPVIAGITMGMFVSLVGMATGRLIAFLWIKHARGGQRGYASVAQTDAETESMEKGDVAVVVAEEPLPRYEDAPAYEEKEQK